MNEVQVGTVGKMREVLPGTRALEFRPAGDDMGRYSWIDVVLRRVDYRQLKRLDRGVVLAYLQRLSGQGDRGGANGPYHINAVDCVARWEVTATVQTISEARLLPVIAQMLEQFPFAIPGFRAYNGSEYVNHRAAAMLDKLRIGFTRSRPRHSNDNGPAETKNGAAVREMFGYGQIPQHHAAHFNTFCVELLNPFLNFHRPCLFSTDVLDPRKPGRIRRIYRPKDAMTPLDKLVNLLDAANFIREGITLADLRQRAWIVSLGACRIGPITDQAQRG